MSAILSDDRVYRYLLTRDVATLRSRHGTVTFVMLNPSTADEEENDPTIRRCMGFARDWLFETLQVVNLYAYRATYPRELVGATIDVVGPANDSHIASAIAGSDLVMCAWGAGASGNANRIGKVLGMIPAPHSLGVTAWGFPRHPLYVKRDTRPVPFAHCPDGWVWGT